MFGYKKSEIIGRHYKNISVIHPNHLPIILSLFQRILKGEDLGGDRIDIQMYKKDGNLIWMDLQGAELNALMGMYCYLPLVKILHTEIWGKEIYTGQSLFYEMKEYMDIWQFVCEHDPLPENWVWADADFIRRNLC